MAREVARQESATHISTTEFRWSDSRVHCGNMTVGKLESARERRIRRTTSLSSIRRSLRLHARRENGPRLTGAPRRRNRRRTSRARIAAQRGALNNCLSPKTRSPQCSSLLPPPPPHPFVECECTEDARSSRRRGLFARSNFNLSLLKLILYEM